MTTQRDPTREMVEAAHSIFEHGWFCGRERGRKGTDEEAAADWKVHETHHAGRLSAFLEGLKEGDRSDHTEGGSCAGLAQGAWQDIATAPKDGTEIIVGGPYDEPCIVRWSGQNWTGTFQGQLALASEGDTWSDAHIVSVPSKLVWQPVPRLPEVKDGEFVSAPPLAGEREALTAERDAARANAELWENIYQAAEQRWREHVATGCNSATAQQPEIPSSEQQHSPPSSDPRAGELDPDLGAIGPGHVCKHRVRWPHPCDECDAALPDPRAGEVS